MEISRYTLNSSSSSLTVVSARSSGCSAKVTTILILEHVANVGLVRLGASNVVTALSGDVGERIGGIVAADGRRVCTRVAHEYNDVSADGVVGCVASDGSA